MSISLSNPAPYQAHQDHVRPNPSNPLVQIKRDRPADLNIAPAIEHNLRAQPSKGGKVTDLNAPTPTKPSLPLPARFKQPEIWADLAAQQHPLYRTSAHTYGQRPPAIQELGAKYYGNTHQFTNTFAGGSATTTTTTHARALELRRTNKSLRCQEPIRREHK